MLISQYGKIIRMDSSTIRESGRSAQGVRLPYMDRRQGWRQLS
jgi:DNA gyrase/topoisomerase IV subunit A